MVLQEINYRAACPACGWVSQQAFNSVEHGDDMARKAARMDKAMHDLECKVLHSEIQAEKIRAAALRCVGLIE